MADHYTLRLAPGMRQRLTDWARRAGLPERTLAQRYVEEGLRHDAHPLIQFLDGPSGRRASLVGRGLDVWEVIATIRDNDGSIVLAAEYLLAPAWWRLRSPTTASTGTRLTERSSLMKRNTNGGARPPLQASRLCAGESPT